LRLVLPCSADLGLREDHPLHRHPVQPSTVACGLLLLLLWGQGEAPVRVTGTRVRFVQNCADAKQSMEERCLGKRGADRVGSPQKREARGNHCGICPSPDPILCLPSPRLGLPPLPVVTSLSSLQDFPTGSSANYH
jgi:hypothetical protein